MANTGFKEGGIIVKRFIKLNEVDNVATTIEEHLAFESAKVYTIDNSLICTLKCLNKIHAYNKIALNDINVNEEIIKYGQVIGKAIKAIKQGELVHVHNVTSLTVNYPEEINNDIIRQMEIEV